MTSGTRRAIERWLQPLALALLLGPPGGALAAGWDVPALMALLAEHPEGRVPFREETTLSVLDAPLVSTGELVFRAPGRLERHTVQPRAESQVIDGDELTVERDGSRRRLRLSQYPELQALIQALRGTLLGDQALLEQHYQLQLQGSAASWRLVLTPRQERLGRWVTQILVEGQRNRVLRVDTLQADGDRSVITIDPEAARAGNGQSRP